MRRQKQTEPVDTPVRSRPERFYEGFIDLAPTELQTLGGVLLALSWLWAWAAIPGGLLVLGGLVLAVSRHLREQSATDYRALAERRGHGLVYALEAVLAKLLVELKLNGTGPTNRISAYVHTDKAFYMIARTSADPTLKRSGRGSYPEGQGVIGQAWSESSAFAKDLPEDPQDWRDSLVEEYGLEEEEVGRISMQSRSLAAVRLETGDSACGVVVVESMRPRGLTAAHLDLLKSSETTRLLAKLVHETMDGLPTSEVEALQKAREKRGRQTVASVN